MRGPARGAAGDSHEAWLVRRGSPPTGAGSAAEPSGKREVARFSGVVGNFASSRAFLTFLADHDDEPVRLDRVRFNEATFEDVITETVEVDGKNVVRVTSVQIFPDCTPPISGDESPSIGRGCGATSFEIVGEQIAQAYGYLTHAVSVYDGYFRVDVTGILSQGVTPVKLEPMTEQATRPSQPLADADPVIQSMRQFASRRSSAAVEPDASTPNPYNA